MTPGDVYSAWSAAALGVAAKAATGAVAVTLGAVLLASGGAGTAVAIYGAWSVAVTGSDLTENSDGQGNEITLAPATLVARGRRRRR